MTAPDASAPVDSTPPGARQHPLRTLLPHAATALVAIAISIVAQLTLLRPPQAAPVPTVTPSATPAPAATSTPPPTPVPQPPLAEGITRQELIDLHDEDDRLWMAIYLIRAISQLADAEEMLRTNDFAGVDQQIIRVDDSLALAYERADDSAQDPIYQLRREASAIRDDLYLRPEEIDERLARLRRSILVLIEAPV